MASRKDLANDIWRACSLMRRDDGTSGVLEYMEQLSWLIFLKVFEDIENRLEDEAKFVGREYQPIIEPRYRWSSWARKDWRGEELVKFIDDEFFPYLKSLTGTLEKEKISMIFNEIAGNRMKSPYNLKDVITIIDSIDFNDAEDSHVLSQVYEDLLLRLGKEGGIAGEFYTPRPIVRLLVKIVDPLVGETIFDPFCGSCGFLAESYKYMVGSRNITVEEYEKLQRETFHAQEKKPFPYLLGVMNCVLHGILTPDIVRKNTLEENIRNIPENKRFHIILTNPPFGGEENEQIQQNFPVRSQATQLLALQYVMKKMRKDGRCGIVLPESMLSTGGAFAQVRKELIESFNLHTIISLPAGVFANVTTSGQGPKTNLLIFDRSGATKEVWYYELPEPEGAKYSRSNPVRDEEFVDCFQKWKERLASDRSWTVQIDQITKNGYDLTAKNPNRIDERIRSLPVDLVREISSNQETGREILSEIGRLLRECAQIDFRETKMAEFLTLRKEFFKISDSEEYQRITVQLHARGVIPRDRVIGSKIKMKKQHLTRKNDLIVAEIDAKVGGFGIVPSELDGAIVSSHYYVYTIDTSKIEPRYLDFYLRSGKPTRDVQAYVKGSLNYASIRPGDFLELAIPLPDVQQQRIISDISEKTKELQALLRQSWANAEEVTVALFQQIFDPRRESSKN